MPADESTAMPRRHAYFMLLQSTSAWRALDPDAQLAHHDAILMRVFDGYPDLTLRRYESVAFAGRCSDVLWWETPDSTQFHDAVSALREARLLGAPWFEVVDTIALVDPIDEPPLLKFAASAF